MPLVFTEGSTSSYYPNLLGGFSTVLGATLSDNTTGYFGNWSVDAHGRTDGTLRRFLQLNGDNTGGSNSPTSSYIKFLNENGTSFLRLNPNVITASSSYTDIYGSSMSITVPSGTSVGGLYFGRFIGSSFKADSVAGVMYYGAAYMFFNNDALGDPAVSTYFTNAIVARGGILQDGATYLTLTGGTNQDTYVVGNLGIGITPSSLWRLNILGGGINLESTGTFTNEFKSSSGGTNIVTIDLSNVTSEDNQLRLSVGAPSGVGFGTEAGLAAATGATQTYGLALTSPRHVRIGTSTDNIYINSSGNVAMGSGFTNSESKLHIRGTSIANTDFALRVDNFGSGGGPILSVRNDGAVLFATSSNTNIFSAITPVVDAAAGSGTHIVTTYQGCIHGTFSDNIGGKLCIITLPSNTSPASLSAKFDCMVSAIAGFTAGGQTCSTRFISFVVSRSRATSVNGTCSVTTLTTGGTNSVAPAYLDISTIVPSAKSLQASLTVNLVVDITGTGAPANMGTILSVTSNVTVLAKGYGLSDNITIQGGEWWTP